MKTISILTAIFTMLLVGVYVEAEIVGDALIIKNEFQYHRGSIDLIKTQIDAILRRPI